MIDWSYINERYRADDWLKRVHPLKKDSDYWVFMADVLPLEYVDYVLAYLFEYGLLTIAEDVPPCLELSAIVNIGPSETLLPVLHGASSRPIIVFNPSPVQLRQMMNDKLGHSEVVALKVDEIGRIEKILFDHAPHGFIDLRRTAQNGAIGREAIYVPPIQVDPSQLSKKELANLKDVAQRHHACNPKKED